MKGFQNFISGVTSNVQHKLGGHSQASSAAAAHKIVDKDFDKEKENLKSFIAEGTDIVKSLKAQAATIRSYLISPLKEIDAGMQKIYGESNSVYLSFQKIYVNVESASIVFDQEQDAAIAKMNECLAAASDLKKLVAQRDAKVNEVDRACVQVFQLQGGRDVNKAQTAMSRYKTLKDEYEKLNAEVLFQIRTLLHQRPERFDAYFKEAMMSWDKFFETGATLFASLESLGVGTSAATNLPPPHPHTALPPVPQKPQVDLLSGDESSAAQPAEPAAEPASEKPPEPEPSTAKSRVEKFGVRMLPLAPTRPGDSQTSAPAAAAPASPSGGDAPPPIPPKPSSPGAM